MTSPITQNVSVAAAKSAQPTPSIQRDMASPATQNAIAQAANKIDSKRSTEGRKAREKTAPRTETQVESQFGTQKSAAKPRQHDEDEEDTPSSSGNDNKLDVVA